MADIAAIAGSYKGVGQWYDSAGKSGSYEVVQTNRTLAAGLEVCSITISTMERSRKRG